MKIKCRAPSFSDMLIKGSSVVKNPLMCHEVRNCQRRVFLDLEKALLRAV